MLRSKYYEYVFAVDVYKQRVNTSNSSFVYYDIVYKNARACGTNKIDDTFGATNGHGILLNQWFCSVCNFACPICTVDFYSKECTDCSRKLCNERFRLFSKIPCSVTKHNDIRIALMDGFNDRAYFYRTGFICWIVFAVVPFSLFVLILMYVVCGIVILLCKDYFKKCYKNCYKLSVSDRSPTVRHTGGQAVPFTTIPRLPASLSATSTGEVIMDAN